MIFTYPYQAKTIKDIDCFIHTTLAGMGVNMNKYNNLSSNTFKIIDTFCSELLRLEYDLDYLYKPTLSNIDFISIDNINKFIARTVSTITKDALNTNAWISTLPIIGYSEFTDTAYIMHNVNKFTDFTRHSMPCDILLGTKIDTKYTNDTSIRLYPYIDNIINTQVDNTAITINIATRNLEKLVSERGGNVTIIIVGRDRDYNKTEETIIIEDAMDIVTRTEWSYIERMLLVGINVYIDIYMETYIKYRYAKLPLSYIDQEEQHVFDVLVTINYQLKCMQLLNTVDNISYPKEYESIDNIPLYIPDGHRIIDHYFDGPNRIFYLIIEDPTDVTVNSQKVLAYPFIIPFYKDDLGNLKRTEDQRVKIEYIRNSINRFFEVKLFPTNRQHSVETLNMSLKHIPLANRGKWAPASTYTVGDMVYYAGIEFICKDAHTAGISFDPDYWINRITVIEEDILLDLINYNIMTNNFYISFDDIFTVNDKAILLIETNGDIETSIELLLQNKILHPITNRKIVDLFRFQSQLPSINLSTIVYPIENELSLLEAKLRREW